MKSILLIGLGKFGANVAEKLYEIGKEVMAVDKDEERVNATLPFLTNALIGDSVNEDFLSTLDIPDYDVCIVSIGEDFQSSLETTLILKQLGAKYIVARAETDSQAKLLKKIGADEIVYPEKQLAHWTAIRYGSENLLDYVEVDDEYSLYEVLTPSSWVGKTVLDVDIRKKYGINILGMKHNGKMNPAVLPDTVFESDKTLLVLGRMKDIQKCFKI